MALSPGGSATAPGAQAAQQGTAQGLVPRALEVHWLGRMPYRQALSLQERVHQEVATNKRNDTLLLVEHDPVFTTGRQIVPGNVLIPDAARKALGIDLVETGRGGDITYHGPGQLVGYPIIALQPHEQDVRAYVHALEQLLIDTAQDFAVTAQRIDGLRGIWVGNDKLAAIGIRLVRWTTLHGFALNVTTRLKDFEHIVPCGLVGRGVTSFAALCVPPPTLVDVRRRVAFHAARALGRALTIAGVTPL